LAGVRVVEFSGYGPGPLCGMILADLGADVVVLERLTRKSLGVTVPPQFQLTNRGKRLVPLDLKSDAGQRVVRELVIHADVLLEGFRPGVMERLGLGPEVVLQRNPRLVYTRITGWGQTGPRAATAGHDITYLAITGALNALGRAGEAPVPPINLLGDYAGGTMFAALGTVAALFEAVRSGRGQVVDAAMVDGVNILTTLFQGLAQAGQWKERGANLLDTGAPFYDVYRTRDGKYVAIGPLESEFFELLAERIDLPAELRGAQHDRSRWPALREALTRRFAESTRDEWVARFEGSDGCLAPVLDFDEAARDPHNVARAAFLDVDGVRQPAPAPRFSRSKTRPPAPVPNRPTDAELILAEWRRKPQPA
jgi:crotonobetainyl-CoA:carnitine CoA-transferase CaiB-like acyl-CoA transferase